MENKGCGIICEYNPFHLGHKYQLEKAKELCDFTVCAMSGDFVQRAEAAFQKKEVRAKNACDNGGDIVLELPFPYSCLGAEGFAHKGVELLTKSGLCSHIMFGSECGDVNVLTDIAKVLSGDGFYGSVVNRQKAEKDLSFARARQLEIESILGRDYAMVLENPNDILAVEYIKAIIKQKSSLLPVPLKRSTPRGGFDESFASSSYIRENLLLGNSEFAKSRLPENYDFTGIIENVENFYKIMLVSLAMKDPKELEKIAEVPKGYGYAIVSQARKSKDYDGLCKSLCSKTMTLSKAKRMLLFCFFGVTKEECVRDMQYTRVLCLSDMGREVLKKYREDSEIIIASRIKDIKSNDKALESFNRSMLAGDILEKCCGMTI